MIVQTDWGNCANGLWYQPLAIQGMPVGVPIIPSYVLLSNVLLSSQFSEGGIPVFRRGYHSFPKGWPVGVPEELFIELKLLLEITSLLCVWFSRPSGFPAAR